MENFQALFPRFPRPSFYRLPENLLDQNHIEQRAAADAEQTVALPAMNNAGHRQRQKLRQAVVGSQPVRRTRRPYTTSIAIIANGSTCPRYAMVFGIGCPGRNAANGSQRVRNVTPAINRIAKNIDEFMPSAPFFPKPGASRADLRQSSPTPAKSSRPHRTGSAPRLR